HSMPMSMPNAPRSPRTLQHLAAANRASPFSSLGPSSPWSARHSRGMSASVLRSPLQNEVPLLKPLDTAASSSPNPELSDLELDSPEPTARDDAPVSDLQALPSSRRIMGAPSPTQVFRARAEWFLRCLALCHTVQPDRDPLTGRITGYQATSPDEKALVAAAAELGYVMNNRAGPLVQLRVVASERMRDFNAAVVNTPEPSDHETSEQTTPDHQSENSASDHESDKNSSDHQSEQSFDRGVPAPHPTDRLGSYEVLDVLEFSSARKRMSVILRCADGRIVMMSKGADSAIWPRLRKPAQLRSDAGDMSFMPRPTPPTDKFATPAPLMLRRKLSQPSAAYLHSRSASMSS
ncbi:drs2 neo1 protein, partial [Coemansia sp. RSA 1824]